MSLLYYTFLDQTSLSLMVKRTASAVFVAGILAQSGGFFLHMALGQPNQTSIGTTITIVGAVLWVSAVAVLVCGSIVAR